MKVYELSGRFKKIKKIAKKANKLTKNPLIRAGIGIIPGGGSALTALDTVSSVQKMYKSATGRKSSDSNELPIEQNQAPVAAVTPKSVFNKTKAIFQNKLNALQVENDQLKLMINKAVE
jgi:hypothetical protein